MRLTVGALEQAIERRQPQPSLVHHSNRGLQYAILLRVGDIKLVTDSSAETVAYSRFLELHNSCTTAAEHDVSGPD